MGPCAFALTTEDSTVCVSKADTFPLPWMDDILDQLGNCKFFSTLDLKSGYWQIRVHPDSQEKTAFITPQGLYEFRVP